MVNNVCILLPQHKKLNLTKIYENTYGLLTKLIQSKDMNIKKFIQPKMRLCVYEKLKLTFYIASSYKVTFPP